MIQPDKLQLAPSTYDRTLDCVQCGLCLPSCPTYTQTGLETDSPRGRIRLIKAAADGRIVLADQVAEHLELCLDCRSCETACPSGVVYHELIESARVYLDEHQPRRWSDRLAEWFFYRVFPKPRRLRWALLPARIMQTMRLWPLVVAFSNRLLPDRLAKMVGMLPAGGAIRPRQPEPHYAARGPQRMRVGYFTGCIGSVIQPHIQRCTIELLQHLGCEVIVPRSQVCCGAIHHHGGRLEPAIALARRNIAAFADVDTIVSDIAGCGAMLKTYSHLLADNRGDAQSVRSFIERVKDINELLAEMDLPIPRFPVRMRVTYHDACHLAHGQQVIDQPRQLLGMIEGLELVALTESDICCGAAGTYNLTQPRMSRDLAQRKLDYIRQTGCEVVVAANVGCAMQIQSHACEQGMPLTVMHPVELLHRAYVGQSC